MSERISVLTEINDQIGREPFDSFLIVMSSGHRYRIEFAEEILVGNEAIILIPLRGGSHSVLRLSEVCSVEVPHRKRSRRR
jgi:hypothetical protein